MTSTADYFFFFQIDALISSCQKHYETEVIVSYCHGTWVKKIKGFAQSHTAPKVLLLCFRLDTTFPDTFPQEKLTMGTVT